jgi:hypothetical protein
VTATAAVRSGVDLGAYLDETVYPALYERLGAALPDFGWRDLGDRRVASSWPPTFPVDAEHKNPERLVVFKDAPWHVWVHGREHVRFLELTARAGAGRTPRGQDFLDAVRKLCELADVPFPERELTGEEREVQEHREARRAVLARTAAYCRDLLWQDAPEARAARAFLRARGLDDAHIDEFGLGLYPTQPDDLRGQLRAEGHDERAVEDAAVVWAKAVGFVTVPWAEEHGQPLTLYGRWASQTPPLKREHPELRRERDQAYAAWHARPPADRGAWEEPGVPKALAFRGKDSKRSPFCFDRVRRAGHRDVVLSRASWTPWWRRPGATAGCWRASPRS